MAERDRSESAPQGFASPMLVPGATLGALVVAWGIAAARTASAALREWSLAIAVTLAAAGCLLAAVVVAHAAAKVAAARI